MDLGLKGKAAVVTGGSTGIGAAIVVALAREGCDVAFTHLGDAHGAADTVAAVRELGQRTIAAELDVADTDAAQRFVEGVETEFGRLDALVCNAGITDDAVVWKMTEEQWDRVLNVNLKGTWNYCRAAATVFRRRKAGRIVNISSINGMRGKFGQSNYTAAKAGILALTKTLARELGREKITVNAIAPGMVETQMMRDLPEKFRQRAADEALLGVIAQPEDVAAMAVFLCSDAARHITGEVIRVDGGQYA